jgi:hypothetical protein
MRRVVASLSLRRYRYAVIAAPLLLRLYCCAIVAAPLLLRRYRCAAGTYGSGSRHGTRQVRREARHAVSVKLRSSLLDCW